MTTTDQLRTCAGLSAIKEARRLWALGELTLQPPTLANDGTTPSQLLIAFQRCFALKLFCTFQAVSVPWMQGGLALCTLAMCSARVSRAGTVAWWSIMASHVVLTMPYTLNHFVLELLVLSVLAVFPVRFEPARQDGEALRLLWLAVLGVWFFAGIQKLAHGLYLNGEFMALQLTDKGDLPNHLRAGLALLEANLTGSRLDLALTQPTGAEAGLSWSARVACVALGWLVPIAEIALPVLACFTRSRGPAIWGLACGQALIGWLSGELDFAITGLALIGLANTRLSGACFALLGAVAVLLKLFSEGGS
jgi:hypothetical protein